MIVQHPNGNSYLFIDNKVFVSAYNEATKTVITAQLDLSLPLNDWEKEQIKIHIGEILPDGFQYAVCIHSYGTHFKESCSTLKEALDICGEYYEDNGFAHLYTTNPNVNVTIPGGDVYYLMSLESLNAYSHPKESKLISKERYCYEDLQNECELNGLENQSNEQ